MNEKFDLRGEYYNEVLSMMPVLIREDFEKALLNGNDQIAFILRAFILQRADQLFQLIENKKCLDQTACKECWLYDICCIKINKRRQ
ncbi:hypothetical protein HZB04_01500 [Candidatus Wolfebacteria bacterium]|nr:hypothetical protein [Candidatus Wolfebacteria bacterium]